MKTFDELFDGVIKHEGYYANVTGDKGGETYMGVARNLHPNWDGWQIIDTYKEAFGVLKRNTKINNPELTQLVKDFYKQAFYDNYNIERINNGSLQEIIFDWCVNSGHWGSKGVQRTLNQVFNAELRIDGIIGKQTLSVINGYESESLFKAIKQERIRFYKNIAKKGQNYRFLNGWLKRINYFEFER